MLALSDAIERELCVPAFICWREVSCDAVYNMILVSVFSQIAVNVVWWIPELPTQGLVFAPVFAIFLTI